MSNRIMSKEEACQIAETSGADLFSLFDSANRIRQHFRGDTIDLCSIINAKSGACPEDCSFCAQSSRSKSRIKVYPLLDKKTLLERAKQAKTSGVKRLSLVTSGRKVSAKDLSRIASVISKIRDLGLFPCASLGLLEEEDLLMLKKAGLNRYHHNLETSEGFFPLVCSTHSYADKLRTIKAATSAGLSVCSGGIFGMGETWHDRIDMAFALRELDVDSVPINFLIPVRGSILAKRALLHPFEALKIISLYRFILPQKEIRVCGGRTQVLGEFHSLVFPAGADGMITGGYLTTPGRSPEDDIALIKTYGFTS